MFSKIGKVKKAWLQLFHADRGAGQAPSQKKHRGFGFVIFYEKQSIDQLMGNELSRFVCVGDLKVEVKRAIGKTSTHVPEEQLSTGTRMKSEMMSPMSPTPPLSWQSPSPAASQTWQRSPSPELSYEQLANLANLPNPASSQACQSSPAASQRWDGKPKQPLLVGLQAHANVPWMPPLAPVPPFPFLETSAAQYPTVPLTTSSSQALPSQPVTDPQLPCQFVPNVLLDGFVGQKPLNRQELKLALLEAMPDHYDD